MASYFTPPTDADVEEFLAAQPEKDHWRKGSARAKLTRDRIKTAISKCQALDFGGSSATHNIGMALQTILDIAAHAMEQDGD